MGDVTISELSPAIPDSTSVIPFSNGVATSKAEISSLPVSFASITGKPNITVSTAAGPPLNTTGNDGDIYYQVT